MPPWNLPDNATQSGILTRSTQKGGYENANAIRFEDKKGQEELWLQAEKDMRTEVENDELHTVDHDRMKNVGNDEQASIGRDQSRQVGRDCRDHVGQDVFTTIGRNEIRKIQNTLEEDIAASNIVRIGENQTFVIEGVQSIEAKTGLRTMTREHVLQGTDRVLVRGPNGKIILDASGITLEAPVIRFKGAIQAMSPQTDQLQAIEAAVHHGTPLVEECPLKDKKDGK